jgi:hypothetical protein
VPAARALAAWPPTKRSKPTPRGNEPRPRRRFASGLAACSCGRPAPALIRAPARGARHAPVFLYVPEGSPRARGQRVGGRGCGGGTAEGRTKYAAPPVKTGVRGGAATLTARAPGLPFPARCGEALALVCAGLARRRRGDSRAVWIARGPGGRRRPRWGSMLGQWHVPYHGTITCGVVVVRCSRGVVAGAGVVSCGQCCPLR